jgi:hypothetical protein
VPCEEEGHPQIPGWCLPQRACHHPHGGRVGWRNSKAVGRQKPAVTWPHFLAAAVMHPLEQGTAVVLCQWRMIGSGHTQWGLACGGEALAPGGQTPGIDATALAAATPGRGGGIVKNHFDCTTLPWHRVCCLSSIQALTARRSSVPRGNLPRVRQTRTSSFILAPARATEHLGKSCQSATELTEPE